MPLRLLARIKPLVRPWTVPLWGAFLWAWSVLAEVHLADFVWGLGSHVDEFVHSHPYWILGAALCGLFLAAVWPEIEDLFPKLPKMLHERVDMHEKRLTRAETRLLVVESANAAEVLPVHGRRIKTIIGCVQKAALLASWLGDMSVFINQAQEIHDELSEIHRRYPQSVVSLHSFSVQWHPLTGKDPDDEPTRLGILWVSHLVLLLEHIQRYPRLFGDKIDSSQATQRLIAGVNAWSLRLSHRDVTPEESLTFLMEHKAALKKLRDIQAASFAEPTLEVSIIS